MLRVPIWRMSAYSATRSIWSRLITSVQTASPVSARALASSLSPVSPSPWNSYGLVRGLKAPPRSPTAPAAFTAVAACMSCFSFSTLHGPAITPNLRPPIDSPLPRPMTDGSCLTSLLATL